MRGKSSDKRRRSTIAPHAVRPTASRNAPRHRILRALAPVLIFSITSVITQWTWFNSHHDDSGNARLRTHDRYGLVNFVEDDYDLWGVYSIHKQMEKFDMLPAVEHVAVVTSDTSPQAKNVLKEWLGPANVREMDKTFITDKVHESLKRDDFIKVEVFNMIQYEKLIVLDSNTLIRTSLLHWFGYPAPAATQAKGTVEWMPGAMMIQPDKHLYRTLLEYLPLSRKWIPGDVNKKDTWNSGDSFRGFLSSFLLSSATKDEMFTMDYANFVQSSDLEERKENQYFRRYRPDSIQTIRFDKAKPWKHMITPVKQKDTCALLMEWAESVADAPEDKLPKLPMFLKRCEELPNEPWATKYV